MSTTIKTGWLKDKNGEKFAPKTLSSQVQTNDGISIEQKIEEDLLVAIDEAKSYTDTSVSNLIGLAPEARNTIEELAKAISDHEDVTDAINEAITKKVNLPVSENGSIVKGNSGQTLVSNGDGTTSWTDNEQADWNQNDENAPDYIKNRTHWIERSEFKLLETTVENSKYEEIPDLLFVEGQTYIVTFNGDIYECVAWTSPDSFGAISIGNGSICGYDDYYGNGEPFCFDSYDIEGTCQLNMNEAGTYTIKIETINEIYHKLDMKYLPDDIARQTYVDERINNIDLITPEDIEEICSSVYFIEFEISHNDGMITDVYQAEEGMTWAEWIESEYYDESSLIYIDENDNSVLTDSTFSTSNIYTDSDLTNIVYASDVINNTIYYGASMIGGGPGGF